MKEMECKTIRQQIEEAELGRELSSIAASHLRQCSSCRDFYDGGIKLRQLVASLPAVEAPADFDFRLRARLANERKPAQRRMTLGNLSFGPSVVVTALALLAGGVLILRSTMTTKQSPTTTTAVSNQSNPVEPKGEKNPPQEFAPIVTQKNLNAPAITSGVHNQRTKSVEQRELVASSVKERVAVKESSSVGATVVKRNDSNSRTQLPLVFPIQTLTVSLDDGSGVSRTISFPTVSFGSERVLTRSGNSFQPPGKSDW